MISNSLLGRVCPLGGWHGKHDPGVEEFQGDWRCRSNQVELDGTSLQIWISLDLTKKNPSINGGWSRFSDRFWLLRLSAFTVKGVTGSCRSFSFSCCMASICFCNPDSLTTNKTRFKCMYTLRPYVPQPCACLCACRSVCSLQTTSAFKRQHNDQSKQQAPIACPVFAHVLLLSRPYLAELLWQKQV